MSVTNGKTSSHLENGANHVSRINSQQDFHEIEVLEQVSAPRTEPVTSLQLHDERPDTSSSQRDWHSKPLKEKLLEYQKAYARTGYIGFSPLEVVARMATKGIVLTPDVAEEIISRIQDAVTEIHAFIAQIQKELEAIAIRSNYPRTQLQSPLRKIDNCMSRLVESIKQRVLPIAEYAESEQREKLHHHLSELDYLRGYLQERFITDIAFDQEIDQGKFQRLESYLTSIHNSAYDMAVLAEVIIEGRVPLYKIR